MARARTIPSSGTAVPAAASVRTPARVLCRACLTTGRPNLTAALVAGSERRSVSSAGTCRLASPVGGGGEAGRLRTGEAVAGGESLVLLTARAVTLMAVAAPRGRTADETAAADRWA